MVYRLKPPCGRRGIPEKGQKWTYSVYSFLRSAYSARRLPSSAPRRSGAPSGRWRTLRASPRSR
eukprot:1225542-Prymnesium_polylepis.1